MVRWMATRDWIGSRLTAKGKRLKRWFLRALQEEFDARLQPAAWNMPSFEPDGRWTPAMVLDCPADKPPACSSYPGGDLLDQADPKRSGLRVREIPPLRESDVPASFSHAVVSRGSRGSGLPNGKRPPAYGSHDKYRQSLQRRIPPHYPHNYAGHASASRLAPHTASHTVRPPVHFSRPHPAIVHPAMVRFPNPVSCFHR